METVLAADRDVLADVLLAGLQVLMEAKLDEHVNVAPYERGASRRSHRNGYRYLRYGTQVGTLDLRFPVWDG